MTIKTVRDILRKRQGSEALRNDRTERRNAYVRGECVSRTRGDKSFSILDETGGQLLEPDAEGRVTGRFAAFNLMVEGHWGGVISGDKVIASPVLWAVRLRVARPGHRGTDRPVQRAQCCR